MGFFYDKEHERQRLEQQRRLAELNREDEDDDDVGSLRRHTKRGQQHPRRPVDDDDEEDFYLDDPEEALIRLLKRIGSIRDQLDQTQGQLSDLLAEEPELHQQYHQFIQHGGITAEDFERFRLKLLRPRLTRSKQHLRLVSSTKAVKRSSRPRDDDAA